MSPSSLNHHLLSIARDVALKQGVLDINEPETTSITRLDKRLIRLTLEDGTPALIYLSRRYREEWIVSIALWPTADAEDHMASSFAGSLAGEAYAWGWLNRWQHNGNAIRIQRFHDARAYVAPHRRHAVTSALENDRVAAA